MTDRNLRLLIVNDQQLRNISYTNVEIVRCSDGYDREIGQIARWDQHMRLWANREIPEFDLLLVDIRFDEDKTDPRYWKDEDVPFGLVHALALAGRQELTAMPFVWAVHSGNAAAVKDDPVALLAYGLLSAIAREEGCVDYDPSGATSIPDYFSQRLLAQPVESADQALGRLIPRYRQALTGACTDGRVYVVVDSAQPLITLCDEIADGDTAKLDRLSDAAVEFYAGYEADAIRLASLFADTESLTPQAVKTEILPFLQRLVDNSKQWEENAVDVIHDCITNVRSSEQPLSKILPRENRAAVGVGVITCLWLTLRNEGQPRQTRDFLGWMNCPGNHHFPNRLLRDAGFNVPLQRYLDRLETEELPIVWRQWGRDYCLKYLKEDHRMDWPACLGARPTWW